MKTLLRLLKSFWVLLPLLWWRGQWPTLRRHAGLDLPDTVTRHGWLGASATPRWATRRKKHERLYNEPAALGGRR